MDSKIVERLAACEKEIEISKEQLRLFGEDLLRNLDLHEENANLHDRNANSLKELSKRIDELGSIVMGILKASFPPNPIIDEALDAMREEKP